MPRVIDEWRIPGLFIRDKLLELGEASPSQVHQLYRQRLKTENKSRLRNDRIHGMTYPSMIRYFRLLEHLGAVKRTGKTIPVEVPWLIRATPDGFEEAVQILYQAIQRKDSPLWLAPWAGYKGVLPVVAPKPKRAPTPKAKRAPAKPAVDIVQFTMRYEGMRRLVEKFADSPNKEAMSEIETKMANLHRDVVAVGKQKLPRADKEALGRIEAKLAGAIPELGILRNAYTSLFWETLPKKVAQAQRNLENAKVLILSELSPLE